MDLWRAAFGDRPDADVWAAARSGDARERWLAAVVLGGQGRYAAAATVLNELRHDPAYASLALSTLASHRRQLGGHALARSLDAAALARASSRSDRSDALLGLAADAIGAGRLAEARRLHASVEPHDWRSKVRHGWVAAEIELASGRAELAVAPAEAAAAEARAAGSLRHILKSDLVLGTSLVVWGTPDGLKRGIELLGCDLNHTSQRGLIPLVWPAALVLVERDSTVAGNALVRAMNALSCVLRRADAVGRQIALESPWVPTALLRSGEPPNADPQAKFLTD